MKVKIVLFVLIILSGLVLGLKKIREQYIPSPDIALSPTIEVNSSTASPSIVYKPGEVEWYKAVSSATLASEPTPSGQLSLEVLGQKLDLWKQSVELLKTISEESPRYAQAQEKLPEYDRKRAWIKHYLETEKSQWLKDIVEQSPLSSDRVMITVCRFDDECRNFQGDREVKDPASLIKVPVAVLTMDKLNRESIDSKTEIKVKRDNYTEDSSDILVYKSYPIEKLVQRMINHSSNIATNELIDYLEFENLNKTLDDLGYSSTYIQSKLTGLSTRPRNRGCCGNAISTDELTKMMVNIYREDWPGNDLLRNFLAQQRDRSMGYQALQGEFITWLGEKTGRHSRFKGTTVAATIKDQDYVITIAITRAVSDNTVSTIISTITDYLVSVDQDLIRY